MAVASSAALGGGRLGRRRKPPTAGPEPGARPWLPWSGLAILGPARLRESHFFRLSPGHVVPKGPQHKVCVQEVVRVSGGSKPRPIRNAA